MASPKVGIALSVGIKAILCTGICWRVQSYGRLWTTICGIWSSVKYYSAR